MLAKSAPVKRRIYHHGNPLILYLVTNVFEDDNFSRKVLERKDWVSVSKTATCKILCNLQEFNAAFQEKHRNVNIGFSKFCA